MSDPRDEILDHVPALRAFARSLTRDAVRADDLVQDALVKAFSNLDKFQAGTNLRAWLFTILRNVFYSGKRKSGREVEDVDGDYAAQLTVAPAHDSKLQFAEFRKAFALLSDERREALTLIGALGLSYEEAAETCGVAVGTMKSRTNRARKELAELMKLDDTDPGAAPLKATRSIA
ncbi:RNA polymerase sigma factor [Paracoccaceae bacterium GXU_MW_L88]